MSSTVISIAGARPNTAAYEAEAVRLLNPHKDNLPGQVGRLLLHTCCAPCAEYPLALLRDTCGIEPVAYFNNPNIHPRAEYEKRLDTLREFAGMKNLRLIAAGQPDEAKWRGFTSKIKIDHCRICYASRFEATCAYAAAEGYQTVASTLFVSPYQQQDLMRSVLLAACRRHGLYFLDLDFAAGFRQGQAMARADGLYRQKYCGCIYSLGETSFRDKLLKRFNLTLADLPVREV